MTKNACYIHHNSEIKVSIQMDYSLNIYVNRYISYIRMKSPNSMKVVMMREITSIRDINEHSYANNPSIPYKSNETS